MKEQGIFRLLLLLCISFLAGSCTERSLELRPEPEPDPEPVAIRLYTGIRTRAAVDAFENTPVCIACGTSTSAYTECWNGVATAGEIVLTPARYYPLDGSPLYLRSFYPQAPLAADGTLAYTLTGEEDLMVTSEQFGSQDVPFEESEEKTLVHRHLLTKLSFRLKLDVPDADKYSIRNLYLNGLSQEVTLSLLTEELSCGEATVSVTMYAATDQSSCFPFENGVASLPGHVLVQPDAEFSIDLRLAVDDNPENDLTYTDLPIRFEGGTGEGGAAYTVSVEVPDPTVPDPQAITVTATVIPWDGGSGGSGDIDGGSPDKK